MSEYHVPLVELMDWTIPMIILFTNKIVMRQERELEKDAKLHGAEYKKKGQGIDFSGAVPLEEIVDNEKKKGG
jgi:hypothetical protein